MQKRTSWDQKNKHIHKSRKKIIDTVFGREDNTQRVFGFEKEGEKKREVGERWVDENGKEWEQKDGYKSVVSKFEDLREYKFSHYNVIVDLISGHLFLGNQTIVSLLTVQQLVQIIQ